MKVTAERLMEAVEARITSLNSQMVRATTPRGDRIDDDAQLLHRPRR